MALGRFYSLFICFCQDKESLVGNKPTPLNKINLNSGTLVICCEHHHRSTR